MKELQENFTHNIRNPEENHTLYPQLVFHTLREILHGAFPLLFQQLNQTEGEKLVRDFIREHPSKTPLYPEIPQEFVTYLHTVNRKLFEIAHYEWVEIALSMDDTVLSALDINFTGDIYNGIPAISPLAIGLHYEHLDDKYLIAYRDLSHDFFYLPIAPLSAVLFEQLKNNQIETGKSLLERLSRESGHPKPALVMENGVNLLNEWYAKNIILGTLC